MTTLQAMIAIRDEGLLAALTHNELRVLLSYVIRADTRGVAWPSDEQIAHELGHRRSNHVIAARSRLVTRGLLDELPKVGRTAPFRVRLPERVERGGNHSRIGSGSPLYTLPNREERHSRIGSESTPESGAVLLPNRDYIEKQPIEADKEACAHTREVLTRSTSEEAMEIFQAYPPHDGSEPAALKAIDQALRDLRSRGHPPAGFASWAAWLLDRTLQYAKTRAAEVADGDGQNFTIRPARWFGAAERLFDRPQLPPRRRRETSPERRRRDLERAVGNGRDNAGVRAGEFPGPTGVLAALAKRTAITNPAPASSTRQGLPTPEGPSLTMQLINNGHNLEAVRRAELSRSPHQPNEDDQP